MSEFVTVRVKVKGMKRLLRAIAAYRRRLGAVVERTLVQEKLRLYFDVVMGGEE